MPKNQVHTTPAGIARFCFVNRPSTKFNPDGEYSVTLALTPDVAAGLTATLTDAANAAKIDAAKKDPKAKAFALHVPGSTEIDKEGNETGLVAFKFNQKAVVRPKGKDAFETTVGRFDAKGKPMPAEDVIGSGSRIKVAYEIIPFSMPATRKVGVKLRLRAVQVLELVKYNGGKDAGDFGFGEEEGYVGETAAFAGEPVATPGDAGGNGDF